MRSLLYSRTGAPVHLHPCQPPNSLWNLYSFHVYAYPTWIVSSRSHSMSFQPDIVSAVSASPSGTSSSIYSDLSPSTPPSLHVVCNIPVIAPRPLPYHSPTFLQFDLPGVDEDLSHPPYTRGTAKRKREAADDLEDNNPTKRHAASPGCHSVNDQSVGTRGSRRQRKR
jgi:hypothetical protein